jgi:branched-chain amino acid transport system substrate-binding protein
MTFKMKSLVAAALLGYSLTGFAADPIKIGVTGPFTGGSSPAGIPMRDAVKLAVNEINAKGGVLGRPLQIVERDDEAKNERGVQIAQELINKEKVVAVLGYINTGVALASQQYFQKAKIPVITNVSAGTLITKQFMPPEHPDNYVFRIAASDFIQSQMMVEEAVAKRKYTKLAILADSTNYGQLGRQDLEKALDKKGMKAVVTEKFNIKDVDMTPQLLKAKQAGAQALLVYGVGPELAQIANGMEKLGWKVPMIGCWAMSMGNFIDNAGKNGDGAAMPQTFIQEGNTPKRKAFIEAYQKAYNPPNGRIASPVAAAQGYDSVYVLAAAIKQAGTTDGPKVRAALENLNEKVEGIVMTYDKPFTHAEHEAIKIGMPVFGEVKNGQIVRSK